MFGQFTPYTFQKYDYSNGIPSSPVNSLTEDSDGYIWISTWNGLHRYNGYEFKSFWSDEENSFSLNDTYAKFVHEDNEGRLWVNSGRRLQLFNRLNQNFESEIDGILCDFDNEIHSIHQFSNRVLCLESTEKIIVYSPETDSCLYLPYNVQEKAGVKGPFLRAVHLDPDGNLWFGSGNPWESERGKGLPGGLTRYDPEQKTFENFLVTQDSSQNDRNFVQAIAPFDDQHLLFSTWQGGLYTINIQSGNIQLFIDITPYATSPIRPDFLGATAIIPVDDVGFFIATYRAGLLYVDKNSKKVSQYAYNSDDPYSIGDDRLFSMIRDHNDRYWIGSASGLISFHPDETFEIVTPSIIGDQERITDVEEISPGTFFMGTDKNRLIRWNRNSDEYQEIVLPEGSCNQWDLLGTSLALYNNALLLINDCGIYEYDINTSQIEKLEGKFNELSVYMDHHIDFAFEKDGSFWFNAHYSPIKVDKQGNYSRLVDEHGQTILNHPGVQSLCKDRVGNLWIGTNNGINIWSQHDDHLDSLFYSENQSVSISFMKVDEEGNIWASTDSKGMVKINADTREIQNFSFREGLPISTAYDFVATPEKDLWVLSNQQLVAYQPDSRDFRIFDNASGLLPVYYGANIIKQISTGECFLGGVGGFHIFDPASKFEGENAIKVVLEETLVNDEQVYLNLDRTSRIKFNHNQNNFRFTFAGINSRFPDQVKYLHRLLNHEVGFQETGKQRTVSYSNLPPGNYEFHVKTNAYSDAKDEAQKLFSFIIMPPWWQSGWAIAAYVFLSMALLYFLYQYEKRRITMTKALEFEKKEALRLKELDEMKSNFFANISHEFRTPLTVILGQLNTVLEKSNLMFKEELEASIKNARKLLVYINQLLSLSKINAGKEELNLKEGDLLPLIKNSLYSFESLATSKEVQLKYISTLKHCKALFEAEKLETVITNLVSNAIKFSPPQSQIVLKVDAVDHDEIQIAISDEGPGVGTEELEIIFERFRQAKSAKYHAAEGTGIGLALAKELTKMHKGTLQAQNNEAKGMTFILRLPLLSFQSQEHSLTLDSLKNHNVISKDIQPTTSLQKDAPIVLVVEDNEDVRSYLKSCLSPIYNVLDSINGKEAYELAITTIPDLIITDVMMPVMDGITFSKLIKKNEATSHIPVIMLTAKASERDRLEGLETGIDDYVLKPFHKKELLLRIRNLLKIRSGLRDKFSGSKVIRPNQIDVKSLDDAFMLKILNHIEEKMEDVDFGVIQLAEFSNLSESQLHRKLKAITGKSPGALIRKMRLHRANDLLTARSANVSEVAFQCGFSEVSSFTRSFKREFGYTPSSVSSKA
ncbi:hybrid sensor histidine kinase/response regulator transcription factor [Portibacter marinus]|uniref:hybrid sensor histidine kinase/response regulator transcription factor n=1 Tax=Portibacter marinus TaxID=2898660 RepID=UPI001F46CE1D|nr:hybrid sensor histidine kinase/response regulator transcription factor [Portibacter marinus]